jgi:hypothetical protein
MPLAHWDDRDERWSGFGFQADKARPIVYENALEARTRTIHPGYQTMRDGIWVDGEYFEAESGFWDESVRETELNRR